MGLKFGQALDPYGLYFFEEPCWPECIEGLAMINQAITTPVATGERITELTYFRQLFAQRGCEICQLDITHCGGLTSARRIAALADSHRIALAPHNPQGPVSTAASLEFGFSQPSYIICETVHGDVPWRADVVDEDLSSSQRPDRASQHASRLGDNDQRRRGSQASVPAGAAAADVLPGWRRRRLVRGKRSGRSVRHHRFVRSMCGASTMPKSLGGVLPIVHTPFWRMTRSTRQACGGNRLGAGRGSRRFVYRDGLRTVAADLPERLELTATIAEMNAGRGVVIAGVGAESTKQALEYARAARVAGCDAVMAIPPISTALPASNCWSTSPPCPRASTCR